MVSLCHDKALQDRGSHNSIPCLSHFPGLNFLIYSLWPRFRTALHTYCPFTAQSAVTVR